MVRRQTTAQRTPKATGPRRPRDGERVSTAAGVEFERVFRAIEDAVCACIHLRCWADLEAAVRAYAGALQVDATKLLHAAMLGSMARYAITLSDPVKLATYAEHLKAEGELATSAIPLSAAIDMLRQQAEHGVAFEAFEAIDSSPARGGVH